MTSNTPTVSDAELQAKLRRMAQAEFDEIIRKFGSSLVSLEDFTAWKAADRLSQLSATERQLRKALEKIRDFEAQVGFGEGNKQIAVFARRTARKALSTTPSPDGEREKCPHCGVLHRSGDACSGAMV